MDYPLGNHVLLYSAFVMQVFTLHQKNRASILFCLLYSFFGSIISLPSQAVWLVACILSIEDPWLQSKKNGAPGATRTPDPQIRSLMLYPTELRVQTHAMMLRESRKL
jgi:hypothetical protein